MGRNIIYVIVGILLLACFVGVNFWTQNSTAIVRFVSFTAVGVLFSLFVAVLFINLVLPRLVERGVGLLLDQRDEPVVVEDEDDEHRARCLVAQGKYAEAAATYLQVARSNPHECYAWVEASRLYESKLKDYNEAIAVLKEAIEAHEWPLDDVAFLMFRMSDVLHKHNAPQHARTVLMKIVETMPNTPHEAHARQKLVNFNREAA